MILVRKETRRFQEEGKTSRIIEMDCKKEERLDRMSKKETEICKEGIKEQEKRAKGVLP